MYDEPCGECGKVHSTDELKVKEFATSFCEKTFPKVWSIAKDEVKFLSKEELAKEMYILGFFHAIMLGGNTHEDHTSRTKK